MSQFKWSVWSSCYRRAACELCAPRRYLRVVDSRLLSSDSAWCAGWSAASKMISSDGVNGLAGGGGLLKEKEKKKRR